MDAVTLIVFIWAFSFAVISLIGGIFLFFDALKEKDELKKKGKANIDNIIDIWTNTTIVLAVIILTSLIWPIVLIVICIKGRRFLIKLKTY